MARTVKTRPNGETVAGERMIRIMMSGDAPHERQMTGFRAVAALKGAAPSKAGFDGGRQVDPLGKQFELMYWPWQPRPFGRDQRALSALKAIRDLDPQAAQAVWNFLRLANPGMNLTAMVGTIGLDETSEMGEAQQFLDSLMQRVAAEYGGGGDQLHNVLTLSLITDGAVAGEVAPTDDLNDVQDWYAIEPILIAFKRDADTHGLMLGQRFRDGTWSQLNQNQVFYVPLDPDVEDPYGRPPMLPALAAVFAKAQMLNDIRAAAHTAGYPRIDVEVAYEAMMGHAPNELQSPERAAELVAWGERQLQTLVKEYESMQVDDTFVHYDWVKIHSFEQKGSSFAFDKLDDMLTRQVNSALKTLPILLGVNESTTEGHGSVQWNIQVAAVNALQRVIKRLIERMANVSLQLAGFPAHARLEYDSIRTIDRLTEAQAETFEINNWKTKVAMGWADNAEASDAVVGHPPVGDPMSGALGLSAPATAPAGDVATVDLNQDQTKLSPKPAKPATDAAWDLLRATDSVQWPQRARSRRAKLKGWLQPTAKTYRAKAREIYDTYSQILIDQLKAEGIISAFVTIEERLYAYDIANSVFGLGYRRDMKKLLRESIREGMKRAGAVEPITVPESLVRRIWQDNKQYVDKIRNDLRDAINSGAFTSLDDVQAWLDSNAYREEMMGDYLAKQGLAGGYTNLVDSQMPGTTFEWSLGVTEHHCDDCNERDGESYTYEQLLSVGFPGSGGTSCQSNCGCSVDEVLVSVDLPAGATE